MVKECFAQLQATARLPYSRVQKLVYNFAPYCYEIWFKNVFRNPSALFKYASSWKGFSIHPDSRCVNRLDIQQKLSYKGKYLKFQGDSIESGMGAFITISTMAAAALGNTFSDVIGIGSSYYVERAAALLGMTPPPLSPVQLDMPVSRRFSNLVSLRCALST